MRALVQLAIEVEVEDKDDVRRLAKELRSGIMLNLISHLERNGIDPADVDDVVMLFNPTITYPAPLSVRDRTADE